MRRRVRLPWHQGEEKEEPLRLKVGGGVPEPADHPELRAELRAIAAKMRALEQRRREVERRLFKAQAGMWRE